MRSWTRGVRAVAAAALVLATLAACTIEAHLGAGTFGRTSLESLAPANGASGISITVHVRMQFSAAMGAGMESYVAVHEGAVTGPAVAGRWSWSADRLTLTFAPDAPLKARTTYVVHMGGGMRDAGGAVMDYGSCRALGGQSVSMGMMGGGSGMMGPRWRGDDGGDGVTFTFTTA